MPFYRRDGTRFGTLCALDPRPVQELERHIPLFELIGELIAHEMEAAEEASDRERFMGVLAHDLRNPLGAAMNALRFITDFTEPDGRAASMLEVAARSLHRMERLIEQLLDFHRGRFGNGIPIVRAEFEPGALVNEMAEAASLGVRGVRVQPHIQPVGDVAWDRVRIGQLLSNLIDNAVGQSPEGSTVDIELRRVQGRAVRLTVINDGPTIPMELRARMFRPFERGRNPGKGVGLGLFISEQIVRAHGGTIRVDTLDKGRTAFIVALPDGMGGAPADLRGG